MTNLSISRISQLNHLKAAKVKGYDVVRMILAAVLLTAAALKAHQLATEPVANNSLLTSRWFLIPEVEFELAFGLALLSGLYKRLLWLGALGCFGLFSLVTLYKGLAGHASCGCFGKVEVSPWHTLVFDVCALGALVRFRPNSHTSRSVRRLHLRLASVATLIITIGLASAYAMASYTPTTVSADGDLIGDSQFVVLEPEKWIGKPFPLLKYIDIGEQLAEGEWIILLHHRGCPDCAEAIPRYCRISGHFQSWRFSVALVEIPPSAQAPYQGANANVAHVVQGKISSEKEWFVTTPTVALLKDGLVRAAWEGKAPGLNTILQAVIERQGVPEMRTALMSGAHARDPSRTEKTGLTTW